MGAFHLIIQVDTSIILSLLLVECQERHLCQLVRWKASYIVL